MEENPGENYYLYVNNNKTLKEDKVKLGLYLYRSIADLLDLISPELNASVSAPIKNLEYCLLYLVFIFIFQNLLHFKW